MSVISPRVDCVDADGDLVRLSTSGRGHPANRVKSGSQAGLRLDEPTDHERPAVSIGNIGEARLDEDLRSLPSGHYVPSRWLAEHGIKLRALLVQGLEPRGVEVCVRRVEVDLTYESAARKGHRQNHTAGPERSVEPRRSC